MFQKLTKLQQFLVFITIFVQVEGQQHGYRYLECERTDEMIHAGPKIHGKVEKKGILPLNLWFNVSQYDFFKNINQKLVMEDIQFSPKDNTLYRASEPLSEQVLNFPMSTRCQVFVDTLNRLIYVKPAKTGGSSITTMFKHACLDHSPNKTEKHDTSSCLKHPEFTEIKDPQTAKQIWNDYFVFTTSRNPYSRAASGYSYLIKRRKQFKTDENFQCQAPSFESFSQNPFILGVQSQKFKCNDNEIHDYLHVEETTQCMMTKDGQFAVDYVLSLENFVEDWNGLVNELINEQADNFYSQEKNVLEQRTYQFLYLLRAVDHSHVNRVSNSREYSNNLYDQCGTDCIVNIANYYWKDFVALGYNDCLSKN
eukprot:TRINITY_DN5646_c1_g1_i2.p1 TRINITY_DN5646_c1_g1~~TRINITY_DN5646_c1_g1_i2.p1  ORF type:complete len:367 (-),score=39.34 TRINITY_DN5646_c1_g1_i2:135-1235(-)